MMKADNGLFNAFKIFDGVYTDFSIGWYKKMGATLCFTMILNSFSPYLATVFTAMTKCCCRCIDRGGRLKIKADISNDEVNSRLYCQKDLEELYTGKQVQSYYIYA